MANGVAALSAATGQDRPTGARPSASDKAEQASRHHNQFGHRRIGEASNPGPYGVRSAASGSGDDPRWQLDYPEPHKPGFRHILTLGYLEGGDDQGGRASDEEFRLCVETSNTTGWTALKRRLRRTHAHILLAQETRRGPEQQAATSQWARCHGWKMVAAPAVEGPNGGNSAGVAVFARSYLGLRYPPKGTYIIEPGRAVAAVVDIPGCRPILAVSAYLYDGQGLSPRNRQILGNIGACVQMQGGRWQTIIGGDFNNEPQEVAAVGMHDDIGALVVHPSTRRGTCRTPAAARTYDFFVMSAAMVRTIDEVSTVEASGVKTHTPVQALSNRGSRR